MVLCHGSMPAEKCADLLRVKLAEFDLDLSRHVTCVTTDGASVMAKFGRSLPCEHQLCFAHGVHLAVIDVLYTGDGGAKAPCEPRVGRDPPDTESPDTESSTDESDEGDIGEDDVGDQARVTISCKVHELKRFKASGKL